MSKSKSGKGLSSGGGARQTPNWPSKTGRPSGKGRDNARAKK